MEIKFRKPAVNADTKIPLDVSAEKTAIDDLANSPEIGLIDAAITRGMLGEFFNGVLTFPGIRDDMKVQQLYQSMDMEKLVEDELDNESSMTELIAAYRLQQAHPNGDILSEDLKLIAEGYLAERDTFNEVQHELNGSEESLLKGEDVLERGDASYRKAQTHRLRPKARALLEVGGNYQGVPILLKRVLEQTGDVGVVELDAWHHVMNMDALRQKLDPDTDTEDNTPVKNQDGPKLIDQLRVKMNGYLSQNPECREEYGELLQTAAAEHINIAASDIQDRMNANQWAENQALKKLGYRAARRLIGATALGPIYNIVGPFLEAKLGFPVPNYEVLGKGIEDKLLTTIQVTFAILFVGSLMKAFTEAREDSASYQKGRERKRAYFHQVETWINNMRQNAGLAPVEEHAIDAVLGGVNSEWRLIDGHPVESGKFDGLDTERVRVANKMDAESEIPASIRLSDEYLDTERRRNLITVINPDEPYYTGF